MRPPIADVYGTVEQLELQWRGAMSRGDSPKEEADLAERLRNARVMRQRRLSVKRMLRG